MRGEKDKVCSIYLEQRAPEVRDRCKEMVGWGRRGLSDALSYRSWAAPRLLRVRPIDAGAERGKGGERGGEGAPHPLRARPIDGGGDPGQEGRWAGSGEYWGSGEAGDADIWRWMEEGESNILAALETHGICP